MKKTFIISLIISFLSSIFLLIINYINYVLNRNLLFAKPNFGGEIIQYYSFGLRLTHIIPLTDINDKIKSYTYISFDLFSFILTFIIIFIIVLLLALIIKKINKKK